MLQSWLTKLTPEQAIQQQQRIAAEVQQRIAEVALRGPPAGSDSVTAAAAATTAEEPSPMGVEDSSSSASAARDSAQRRYTSWLTSQWFPYIHEAVRRLNSLRGAVAELQRRFPRIEGQQQAVFNSLGHGTLQRWYELDSDGKYSLRPEFERYLPAGRDEQPVPGGRGPTSWWDRHPRVTTEIRATLSRMRDSGVPLGLPLVRWVIQGIAAKHQMEQPPLSTYSVSEFARKIMFWSWRKRTTAAIKLPDDWRAQGTLMARRIAALMHLSNIPAANVVNIDQTGIVLVPATTHTYEQRGAGQVAIVGAEEKRQITAVLGSTLQGEMLPLQLIFEGKTERSRAQHITETRDACFHLTNSENHWSTLQTMQEYVENVLEPWRRKQGADSEMILLLDAWSVHRSKEFRNWMSSNHAKIHLVYIPANCTSMLQVADVALNRPFKSSIRKSFNEWAASIIVAQIAAGEQPSLKAHLSIKELRPRILDWSLRAWQHLCSGKGKLMVLQGWRSCVKLFFDVEDKSQREAALKASVNGEFRVFEVPDTDESPSPPSDVWDGEDDGNDDNLDLSKPRVFGQRRSKRKRGERQRDIGSYMLDSSQICISDDSD